MSLFQELKQRNVFRVAIAYAVTAWILLQLTEVLTELLELSTNIGKTVIVLLLLGFIPALIFAWAFELTPEGLKRESEVDRSQRTAGTSSRTLDRLIIGVLVVALGYFVYESRFKTESASPDAATPAQPATPIPPDVDSPAGASRSDAGTAVENRSVAILPFVNMSPDPSQEYFSDGITEEIINAVVKIPGISVPARTSVFAYKDQQRDLRQVGAELGVAHVIEGSIRSQGDQVRITAQLIAADDGFHLWSATYDRRLDNIFAVQEEIAAAIAAQLVGKLDRDVDMVPNQTRNMAAYDLYLRGRAALRQRSPESQALLEQAIEADPDFAPAYAALAIALNASFDDNDRAVILADQALALDPDNVDALNAKAAALRSRLQWAEAEAVFLSALEIDPNSAELLEDWAEFLSYVGRVEEALAVTERGIAIDRALMPLRSAHIEALLSNSLPERALEEALESIELAEVPYFGWVTSLPVWLDPTIRASGAVPPPEPPFPQGFEDLRDETTRIGQRFLASAPDNVLTQDDLDFLKASYVPGTRNLAVHFGSGGRFVLIASGEIDHVIATDIALFDTNELPLWEWQWVPDQAALRAHPDFGRFLEKANLVAYWDEAGCPNFCNRDSDSVVRCR